MARHTNRSSSLASLRAIPGLVTLRPADANEVVEAYRYIVQLRHAAGCIGVVRAKRCRLWTAAQYGAASGVSKGAYVLADSPWREARCNSHRLGK